jgi:competence protein ComEA
MVIIKSKSSEIKRAANICVYICGEVTRPGVYMLEDGCRVVDAITVAGGAAEGANLKAINLAQELSDGMMINVPDENAPDINSDQAVIQSNKKLNINTANAQQLDLLPGIGPSLAERIIRYRQENGKFNSIDELLNVSGIGEKKLEEIRELVDI